jgi:hydrogenase nickel incorporation protein HypB
VRISPAAAVEFNREIAYNNIQAVRPGMKVFQVSAKSADGIRAFLEFLAAPLAELRQAAIV